jgi:hypothetical protein
MSFLTILYNTFTPIFLIVGAVIVVGRYVPLDARVFSRAIIYLFTPALVLNSIATTELSANEMGRVILATIGCGLVMAGLAWGVARLMGFSRQFTGTFLATAIIMNGLNFGIPFIRFAFGDHAYDRAVCSTSAKFSSSTPSASTSSPVALAPCAIRWAIYSASPCPTPSHWALWSICWAGSCPCPSAVPWPPWPRRQCPVRWSFWACN